MKNKRNERLKQLAKREVTSRSKAHRNWNHELGIKIYHCYDSPRERSYWDDVSFMWGSKYVCVCWTHPRYQYEDHIDTVAYEHASKRSAPQPGIMDDAVPTYVKRGRSRKSVVSWTSTRSSSNNDFYSHWTMLRDDLLYVSDYVQKPKLEIIQKDYCLMMHVCCPVEVRNVTELKALTDLMRDILDQKVSFNEMFKDYEYGSAQYAEENPEPNPC